MKSHIDLIYDALKSGETLTGLDILYRFNCMNYKGRISDLRKRIGEKAIKTEMKTIGTGKARIAHYTLVLPKQSQLF